MRTSASLEHSFICDLAVRGREDPKCVANGHRQNKNCQEECFEDDRQTADRKWRSKITSTQNLMMMMIVVATVNGEIQFKI